MHRKPRRYVKYSALKMLAWLQAVNWERQIVLRVIKSCNENKETSKGFGCCKLIL